MPKKAKPLAVALVVIVAALAWCLEQQRGSGPASGDGAIERAFREKRSKLWVEDEGRIVHLLPDDRVGDRHQRFLVELASGHTIKISHNVDLAPKAPVKEGDRIRFRGRFEWNDKGGVVHWTHHDPAGRRPGGWLELGGKRYE